MGHLNILSWTLLCMHLFLHLTLSNPLLKWTITTNKTVFSELEGIFKTNYYLFCSGTLQSTWTCKWCQKWRQNSGFSVLWLLSSGILLLRFRNWNIVYAWVNLEFPAKVAYFIIPEFVVKVFKVVWCHWCDLEDQGVATWQLLGLVDRICIWRPACKCPHMWSHFLFPSWSCGSEAGFIQAPLVPYLLDRVLKINSVKFGLSCLSLSCHKF